MKEELYKALHATRLYEQVIEQIETLIFEGQLKQGDRLPSERTLSERFGVSRTVVREAVKALQEKGLVEIRAGVGTFIYDGVSDNMRQSLERMVLIDQEQGLGNLIAVREIFEPQIAAIAAEKATPAEIAAMQAAIQTMDESMTNVEAFIAADHAFHLALARATQNQLIVNLIASIVDLLSEQRRQTFSASVDAPRRGQAYHKGIFQAVIKRDGASACNLMIRHLEQVRSDTRLHIDHNEEG